MERMKLDIQLFADGKVVIEVQLDEKQFQQGLNQLQNKTKSAGTSIKSIIAGLGITKLIGSAFNAITKNMDAAISRLDIMNNFPKVMSNLGISASDSQKAIDKLSKGLQGIPTSLDAGALAVQRFTSKNGDVQKSVDIFLAVNDAILAGGASTEIQASALEQLSQSYAKGKMDMMEWRTIQSAMPAQLKQVASAMGMSTEQLGIMLREGKEADGWMDKFIGTIIEMDKKGVKGFKSLSEQARNSTGGIKTNIANMNTAIVRGLANVISAFDKGLKKAKLGTLGDNISKIGTLAENVLKKVGKSLENIKWDKVISAIKLLASGVAVATSAFIAYNTVLKITDGINLAKNLISATSAILGLTSATELSAGAMGIFNAVMSANPIGLVVAGIAGLTAGLVLLSKHLGDQNDQIDKNNKTLENYKKGMEETKKEAQDYIKTNGSELMHYQNLKNELDGLIDKNGKVKKGYEERAKFIVSTLNDALGTEIKITNGVIKNYDDLSNSIQDVINKKKAQIFIDAHEKEYQKAIQESTKLLDTYTSALNESNKAHNAYNKWLKETADKYGISAERLDGILKKKIQYNEATQQEQLAIENTHTAYAQLDYDMSKADKSLKEVSKTYRNNQKVIADYELATQHMSEKNYDAVYKIYRDTINYQGKTDKETYNNYQKSIETLQTYLEEVKKNRKKYSDEEYNALVTAGQTKIKELKSQQEQYKTEVSIGQKNIVSEVSKGLQAQIDTLNGKKGEFNKSGSNNMSSYGSGISGQKNNVNNKAKEVGNSAINQLEKKDQAYTKGQNLSKGFSNGISSLADAVKKSATNIANGALSAMQKALNEHSPSKETREMGINFDKGLLLGIEDESNNLFKVVEDFGGRLIDKMHDSLLGSNVGQLMAEEIQNDFDDGISDIYNNMQRTIDMETGRISTSIQSGGTYKVAMTGSQTFNLKDNSTNQTQLVVNGRVLAEVVNTENRNREVAKA